MIKKPKLAGALARLVHSSNKCSGLQWKKDIHW